MVAPALVRELPQGSEVVIRQAEIDMTTRLEALQDRNESSAEPGSIQSRGNASRNMRRQRKEPRNAGPIVCLRPTGDGRALARTLARVLVRRALIREGAMPALGDCTITEHAA